MTWFLRVGARNCILVAWGFETQMRLMWTKIDFVVVAYLLTFLGCMAFGVRQLRIFQKVDMQNSTHKDYAARIRNLPLMDGTEPVEEELKKRALGKCQTDLLEPRDRRRHGAEGGGCVGVLGLPGI